MSLVVTRPLIRGCRPSQHSVHGKQKETAADSFTAARLALGKQMYFAGIDDGKTYGAIMNLTRAFSVPGLDFDRQSRLRAERERLFLQLADEALQYDAPLPGAEREYEHARMLTP